MYYIGVQSYLENTIHHEERLHILFSFQKWAHDHSGAFSYQGLQTQKIWAEILPVSKMQTFVSLVSLD